MLTLQAVVLLRYVCFNSHQVSGRPFLMQNSSDVLLRAVETCEAAE